MALDLCKYYKRQKFVTYNDGLTWQPLEEYERGELYEAHSASCGGGVFQYRWILINNGYICDGKDRYTREIYQYSEDGQYWYNVFPTMYRKGTLVETNSPFCDNAGNGQYTSGGTDPTSGDTHDCPPGFIWNPTSEECVCNGRVNASGDCEPCPDNYKYNMSTDECECQGHFDDYGNCIVCQKNEVWDNNTKQCICPGEVDEHGNCLACPDHSSWNGTECVCDRWWEMRDGVCVYVDPLKTVKCEDSDGVLRQSDTSYYNGGWNLLSYTVGDCIYRIDDNAFNGHSNMTSITISETVEEVGDLAFANCRSLTSVTFPSDISVLESNTFLNCSKLKNITFQGRTPNVIPSYMCDSCISLESINWLGNNNISSIGNFAFRNCSSLTSITLPQTLNYIGNGAFNFCTSIQSVEIPSGVTSIGYSAFRSCHSLTNVSIKSNNISIGRGAFSKCIALTSVTVDSSGITMGNDVFSGCTRLLKMTFTSPTPFEISSGFFDNTNECNIFVPCGSLEAYKTAWSEYADRIYCNDTGVYYRWRDTDGIYCEGTDAYTRQKQQQTTNGITWTDNGVYRPIDFITHYSKECNYQSDVALTVDSEDGWTRYFAPCDEEPHPSENSKFFAYYSYGTTYDAECDGSNELTSGNVRSNSDTHSPYSSITDAIIGNCVTSIGNGAFSGCTSLKKLNSNVDGLFNIPNNVITMGSNLFTDCPNLTSCTIGSGVTTIAGSFSGCYSLKNIDITSNVITIGSNAFNGCSGLTSINIPNSVTSIGNSAFNGCSGLTSVTVPSGVTSIGNSAFAYTNFTSLNIPDSVTTLGSKIFDSSYIHSITIGSGVTSSNSSFSNCWHLSDVSINSNVTEKMFYSTNLENVNIGNNVTTIGSSAFTRCTSLTSVTIGSGVTSISDRVFSGCSRLTSVIIYAVTPPSLSYYVFNDTNSCPIYVPENSVNAYKSATRWSSYASRIQAIPNINNNT